MEFHQLNAQVPSCLNSLVMLGFPWYTDTLISESNLVDYFGPNHGLHPFLRCLQDYEKSVKATYSPEMIALRASLRLTNDTRPQVSDFDARGESQANNHKLGVSLCSYICAHRLVDVMALVEGRVNHIGVPQHRKQDNFGDISGKSWEHLNDWPKLLSESKKYLHKVSPQKKVNTLLGDAAPRYMKFLVSITQRETAARHIKVLTNIDIAALNLHIMLEGNLDLPDSVDWFIPKDTRFLGADDEVVARCQGFLKTAFNIRPHRFRLGLQLCLIISPLWLFVPAQLHKKDWDRFCLLLVSKSIGNQKPLILLEVEVIAWKALFAVARGEIDADAAFVHVMNTIPWEKLAAVGSLERYWFRPATSEVPCTQVSLHISDIDGEVPPGWPLTLISELSPDGGKDTNASRKTIVEGAMANMHTDLVAPTTKAVGDRGVNLLTYEAEEASNEGGVEAGGVEAGSGHVDQDVPMAEIRPSNESAQDFFDTTQVGGPSAGTQAGDAVLELATERTGGLLENDRFYGTMLKRPIGQPNEPTLQSADLNLPDGFHDLLGPDAYSQSHAGSEMCDLRRSSRIGSASASLHKTPKPFESNQIDREHPPTPRKYSYQAPRNGSKRKPLKTESNRRAAVPADVGSSKSRPIEIDIEIEMIASEIHGKKTINLDTTQAMKFHGNSVDLYDARGGVVKFTPSFHARSTVSKFQSFVDGVRASFVEGLPPHVARSAESVFCILSSAEYESKSHQEIQNILREKHIIVTETQFYPMKFDETGLESLKALDATIDIQDQSYLTDDDNSDVDDIVRQGTLRQMLESSRMENGKCLNAFFPGITGTSSTPFSSDRYAWRQTEGLPFCHEDSQYPTHDMRLGLAATKGTFHFWRLDSDGLGKYIDIMTGILWWIIARPCRSSKGFAKTTMYVDGFDPECPNLHLWDLEAVVLKPGDKIIMPPNSPHAIVILDHSICFGRYFYATSTMQDTAIGLMHTFIGSSLISNGTHFATRAVLRRMALFYHKSLILHERQSMTKNMSAHLPDPSNLDSLFDLLAFCTLLVTLNALDFRTYESSNPNLGHDDQNAIKFLERIACMYARGKVLELLGWLDKHYNFIDNATKEPLKSPLAQVLAVHLSGLHEALLSYKEMAFAAEIHGPDGCSLERFQYQLTSALESVVHTEKAIYRAGKARRNGQIFDFLGWNTTILSEVRLKKNPAPFYPQKDYEILSLGMTEADIRHNQFLRLEAYEFLPPTQTSAESSDEDTTVANDGKIKKRVLHTVHVDHERFKKSKVQGASSQSISR